LRPVVLATEAATELKLARIWYEERQVGLGAGFVADVRRSLLLIQARPELSTMLENEFRRRVLQGFPYSIVYRIEAEQITVVAIWHASRDPNRLQKRLR
jgi:toxin ParE1/3/4